MKLSVVIPVFNEANTIDKIVAGVRAVDVSVLTSILNANSTDSSDEEFELEILIVDDGSTDDTSKHLESLEASPEIKVFRHEKNSGKGASLRTGFQKATGDIVIVQDADLEYDPSDYVKMITPLLTDKADVVFGSRFVGGDSHRVLYFWHSVGNKFLTLLSNMLTNLNLTDMEVGYKAFRKEILDQITLREDRFGFEPEITAKVARLKCRIHEVGISYAGRTYEDGKKIGWKDGVRAIWCILKYNLWSRK